MCNFILLYFSFSKIQHNSRESKKVKPVTEEKIVNQENDRKSESKSGKRERDLAEVIQLLQQVITTMNGKMKHNSLIPEDTSEVDSISVNALVRRISHTRY